MQSFQIKTFEKLSSILRRMRFRGKPASPAGRSGMTKRKQFHFQFRLQFQLQQKKQVLLLKPAFFNQIMNAI